MSRLPRQIRETLTLSVDTLKAVSEDFVAEVGLHLLIQQSTATVQQSIVASLRH